jgi:hypothetical protein
LRRFKPNTPADFETEHGSRYVVSPDGLTRRPYYERDTPHVRPGKTIFYISAEQSNQVLDDQEKDDFLRACVNTSRTRLIYYTKSGSQRTIGLNHAPERGLCPLDVFLTTDGQVDHGLHVGDKITQIN